MNHRHLISNALIYNNLWLTSMRGREKVDGTQDV